MSSRVLVRSLLVALVMVVALPLASAGQATQFSERFTEPFLFEEENPCSGEVVTMTGELTITLRTVFDANGGLHQSLTLVPHNVRGVGEDGTVYKAVGGQRESINIPSGGVFNYTFTSAFNMISQGGDDNFTNHLVVHVTIDANGNVVSDVFNGHAECRG